MRIGTCCEIKLFVLTSLYTIKEYVKSVPFNCVPPEQKL